MSYIGENLFHPKLNVTYLETEVADKRLMGLFGAVVRQAPFRYIEDRRMETACQLLVETDLRIWQISELLGFKTLQVFSRAFTRWSEMRPTVYRKRFGSPDRSFSLDRLAKQAGLSVPQLLSRCMEGKLAPKPAKALIDRLRETYPNEE